MKKGLIYLNKIAEHYGYDEMPTAIFDLIVCKGIPFVRLCRETGVPYSTAYSAAQEFGLDYRVPKRTNDAVSHVPVEHLITWPYDKLTETYGVSRKDVKNGIAARRLTRRETTGV